MARLNQKDKILKLAKNHCVTPAAMSLLESIIQNSDNGLLKSYSEFESKYVIVLCDGSYSKYYESYIELLTSKKIIIHDRAEDIVYIKPFTQKHYINLIIDLKNLKRKYVKESAREKQNLLNVLTFGKYGNILTEAINNAGNDSKEINYTTKTNGFKVPDSLRSYLTSEPLSIQGINSLLKHNKELLSLEEQRRDLNKEEKRVYCACIAFSDTNGVIEDYNIHSLVQSIKRVFGEKSFCASTVYLAIAKLLDLKLVEEFTEIKSSLSCLKVTQYKESFDRNEHYVTIPNIVLDKAFKKLQASAIKLFFYFIFLLNNGEDANKYVGQDKAIYFKLAKLSENSQESRNNYEMQQAWLRKRYFGELTTLVWGSPGDNDYSALGEFFHFHATSDTALQIRIRREYFISKKAETIKQFLTLKGRYKKRTITIEDTLKGHEIEYEPEELISLIKLFKGANTRIIKLILGQLADRITEGLEKGWDEIRNISAYVFILYTNYKSKSINSVDTPDVETI